MPLRRGKGNKTISQNIEELMASYHEEGRIGNTTPRNEKHAMSIAQAIAYARAGRSRGR